MRIRPALLILMMSATAAAAAAEAQAPARDTSAVALDYVEVDAWQDPDYLESLRRYAEGVTIHEGGTHSLALKVVIPK